MDIRKIIKEEIEKIFLSEEKGVSEEVIKATNEVVKKIAEYEEKIQEIEWDSVIYKGGINLPAEKYEKNIEISFNDLFFEDVSFNLTFVRALGKNIPDDIISISNRAKLFRNVVFNEKNGKIKNCHIDVKLCYNKNIDNYITRGVISHELSHLYESFKRKSPELSKKHEFYNAVHSMSIGGSKLEKITFLFYCMCYFELNANIHFLYEELYGNKFVNDYKDGLKWYYNTVTYKENLINLEKPENIIGVNFVKTINKNDLQFLNSSINDVFYNLGIKNEKFKKYLYFNDKIGTIETYFERIKNLCKELYKLYFKRVGKVIIKVVDDKNKSFLKEDDDNYKFALLGGFIIENGVPVYYKDTFKKLWR